ncbi:MAG: tRNA preQ1(34) S-adenosylmethionine ribosyltransferase-isomerase QueA [Chloroflexota bacterium]
MKTSDFDYQLAPHLIAQRPLEPRDASRLLVVDRADGSLAHRTFREIAEHLRPADLLVFNDTRVIPARLIARKAPSGGKLEMLLVKRHSPTEWEVMVTGRRAMPGQRITVAQGGTHIEGQITALTEAGGRRIVFDRPLEPALDALGEVPLPPYIHEPLQDPERYQTIYARVSGSSAAPTAGLHFTPDLLLSLREMGVNFAFVTLHIGMDTFRPVQSEQIQDHTMHTEWCSLSIETARQINQTRLDGGRLVAVGTTAVRVLETAAAGCAPQGEACAWQTVAPFEGPTDLFITPGYHFCAVDVLLTNFHLPRSTLLMLVSAFAGKPLIDRAYRQAIAHEYRFYSFGDAMLIL